MKNRLIVLTLLCSLNFVQAKQETVLSPAERDKLIQSQRDLELCYGVLYNLYCARYSTKAERTEEQAMFNTLDALFQKCKCEQYKEKFYDGFAKEQELNKLYNKETDATSGKKIANALSPEELARKESLELFFALHRNAQERKKLELAQRLGWSIQQVDDLNRSALDDFHKEVNKHIQN